MAGVLDGITVLDLTRNIAGPYCTQILGDLGAEVIKVERPGIGDDIREWKPPTWAGYSATFLAFNRNKKSLAVDLDRPEGQEIVGRLAGRADVLVESFRRGSLARRGLGYEQLGAANPRLVYCSITGFGNRGPHRDRPGYDPVIQAYSGIMSITGDPDGPPVRAGTSLVDMGAGMWCALAVVGALFARERTGSGARIESSLLEVGVAWVCYQLAGYLGTGKVPGRLGSRAAMIAPYETFATMDEDLFLAAPNDQIFVHLCRVLEMPRLLQDPRFATNADRVTHREELHAILEERLKAETAMRWETLFLEQQIPCSRIRTLDQVVADPQVAALDLLMAPEHPGIPDLRLVDLPVEVDGRRASRRDPPPEVGQHTDEILARLGYGQEAIRDLRRAGVIA
ncbi:MAG: CoA transferase [Armatimonadetes bacterium]|nr:CoA transferase [Armatimonadota bacterium]